jgi:hypothetical protein
MCVHIQIIQVISFIKSYHFRLKMADIRVPDKATHKAEYAKLLDEVLPIYFGNDC